MSHIKKYAPRRRFEKFSNADDWEQRKLGEESDVRDGTHDSPKYVNTGHPLVTSKNLKDFGLDFSDVSFISDEDFESINKRSKVDVGDILFGMIGTIGTPVQLIRKDFAIKNVALIKEKKNILNSFLIHLLKSAVFDRYIENENTGGTQKFLSLSKIRDFYFLSPKLEEQYQISLFFKQLDSTIALHQRKLEKIKALKTAYLSEMFPAEGETKPKRRFAGFTDDWEQRKLGEIANSFEYGLNASSKTYDGENKYIRITDIDESSHVFNQDNLTSPNLSLDKLNHYLLEEGDILLARTGASTGKSYYYSKMDGKVFFAGFLIRAKIKQEYNVSFIFQNTLTERYNNFIQVTSQRSGQPGINAQEYARFALYIPELKEQQKIGVFFKQLDNAIALHQRKLQKLQNIKKAYLNEMFI
ncbi:restriction endonuclease subunit S [Listeria monocytogenes]|uniref:restriction endonuclease subunit S n=1 Tax=Listeria monocytogenes TaxID=1639 RepID=UPI0011EE8A8F|nr:restriction endonuclease subunit S [Listeria monocytogenes]TYV06838.1 restriction endonuclease subunit S [Listeria monocytogenes]